MKIYLHKTNMGLYPAYFSDSEALSKVKDGVIMECEIKVSRDYQKHKKFFALLKLGFDAQKSFTAFDWWREWITIKAGYFESCQAPNGEYMYRAKSIRFEKMDELEFNELFRAVSQQIIEVCKITPEQLEENLKLFL